MGKNKKILLYLLIFAVLGSGALFGGFYFRNFDKIHAQTTESSEFKDILNPADTSSKSGLQKVVFRIDNAGDVDRQVEDYLRNLYPIISDKAIEQIESSKWINKFLMNDSLGIVEFYANFYVPKYYLEPHPKILWELNIAAFESHIYQIFNGDTVLIDTWPNVLGKPSTKTYTGHYEAFRLRNWPFWKDPESSDSVRPTPPGPANPLGLFVVHYDENSLRYFHGTNKNYLLKNEYRALSHGCVRNLNENIARMKEFIIKKVVVSEDLYSWLGSKKTMTFEMKDEDKFPVRIIYKTFDIRRDDFGDYIIFYKDVYDYSRGAKLSEYDDPNLITFASLDNILAEFKLRHSALQIPDEKIIPIINNLLSNHEYYQKYYFDDLVKEQTQNN